MLLKSIIGNALLSAASLWPVVSAAVAARDARGLTAIRQAGPACTEGSIIKNLWFVEKLNVTYTRDELVKPGNASWAITNTLTNTTQQLRCNLRANYACEFKGTPGDAGLYIWLQINLDVAAFYLNQSVSCATGASSM